MAAGIRSKLGLEGGTAQFPCVNFAALDDVRTGSADRMLDDLNAQTTNDSGNE